MSNKPKIRACDPCKLRKVKCNGESPCPQCAHTGLRCLYSAAKPRSQGRRGRIISEYRRRTSNLSSTSPGSQESLTDDPTLNKAFFLELIPKYNQTVYPVHPILSEEEVRQNIESMDTDQEACSYVYAFAACTLNLAFRRTPEVVRTIERLIDKSLSSRQHIGPRQGFKPSVRLCMISLHLHNCLGALRELNASFFYLRDAATHAELFRIEDQRDVSPISVHVRVQRQRLYWLVYVQERFVCISDYRQATLLPLKQLPENDSNISIGVQEGFNQIIRLFKLIDADFVQNWLGIHEGQLTAEWIEKKQTELDEQIENPGDTAVLTSMQKADLVVTKQWLKTVIWRLAMANTVMSSSTSIGCLSLLYPIRISKQLRQELRAITKEDIEAHGTGIIHKLFEVTNTVADVIIAAPAYSIQDTAARVDDFLFLAEYLSNLPTWDVTAKRILSEKFETLQNMFPKVNHLDRPVLHSSNQSAHTTPNGTWCNTAESTLPTSVESVPEAQADLNNSFLTNPLLSIDKSLFPQYNDIANQLSSVDFIWTGLEPT